MLLSMLGEIMLIVPHQVGSKGEINYNYSLCETTFICIF